MDREVATEHVCSLQTSSSDWRLLPPLTDSFPPCSIHPTTPLSFPSIIPPPQCLPSPSSTLVHPLYMFLFLFPSYSIFLFSHTYVLHHIRITLPRQFNHIFIHEPFIYLLEMLFHISNVVSIIKTLFKLLYIILFSVI